MVYMGFLGFRVYYHYLGFGGGHFELNFEILTKNREP